LVYINLEPPRKQAILQGDSFKKKERAGGVKDTSQGEKKVQRSPSKKKSGQESDQRASQEMGENTPKEEGRTPNCRSLTPNSRNCPEEKEGGVADQFASWGDSPSS